MNPKTFLPSLIAVLLACGMLSTLWIAGKLEPANSKETPSTAAEEPAAPEELAAAPGVGKAPKVTTEGKDDLAHGKEVYKKANCAGCHKWHGGGGGSYGGAALSLRETILNQEQIVEVIACGRPGTGMPAFHRQAYKGYDCFGMTWDELGEDKPPKPPKRLRIPDIESVAAYIVEKIKGKGDMTKAQCVDFWGEGARECGRFE
ncbi:MAG: cytochrome c [Alphaproteobacteria bacterium]|nr:cytochrome c [Alphaproteobacteria bacterium]